jgi:hypothetical protein
VCGVAQRALSSERGKRPPRLWVGSVEHSEPTRPAFVGPLRVGNRGRARRSDLPLCTQRVAFKRLKRKVPKRRVVRSLQINPTHG